MPTNSRNVPKLGGLHQLTEDAYAAQHTGPTVPAIGTPFALIGLHLALELGWSGNAVRAAHQYLAAHYKEWPRFDRPSTPATMTVAHVVGSSTPEEHGARVRAWAASVWESWSAQHPAIREWAYQVLDEGVRAQLASA